MSHGKAPRGKAKPDFDFRRVKILTYDIWGISIEVYSKNIILGPGFMDLIIIVMTVGEKNNPRR